MDMPVASPPVSADPHQRISLIELLGYCGIAAGLYGTFAVLAETSRDTETTVMITSLVLAAVFLAAGALIGVGAHDRLARMRSACWFASVIGFSAFLGFAMEPDDKGGIALLLGLSAVYALVLWAFSPRLLQQFAFFTLALNTVAVLVGFPNLGTLLFGPPDLTGAALVYWIGGGLWFALGFLGLARPARTAMVIGLLFGLEGLFLLAQDEPELAFTLVLASSAVCLYLGGLRGDRAVTGIAVVGLLIGTVGVLGSLEVEGTAQGLLTMLIGVVSLGLAVWSARDTGPGGSRPLFGSLRSPFGRPPGSSEAVAIPPAPVVPPEAPSSEPGPPSEPPPLPSRDGGSSRSAARAARGPQRSRGDARGRGLPPRPGIPCPPSPSSGGERSRSRRSFAARCPTRRCRCRSVGPRRARTVGRSRRWTATDAPTTDAPGLAAAGPASRWSRDRGGGVRGCSRTLRRA